MTETNSQPGSSPGYYTRHRESIGDRPQAIRRWYEVWAIDPVTVRMNPALVAKMLKENLQTGKPGTMKSLPISMTRKAMDNATLHN
jgi:hypothetical protein